MIEPDTPFKIQVLVFVNFHIRPSRSHQALPTYLELSSSKKVIVNYVWTKVSIAKLTRFSAYIHPDINDRYFRHITYNGLTRITL